MILPDFIVEQFIYLFGVFLVQFGVIYIALLWLGFLEWSADNEPI